MADNIVVRMSLDTNSVDSDSLEDPLIEMKKLNDENNRLKIQLLEIKLRKLIKWTNWMKLSSGFSILLILCVFAFLFSYFHSNMDEINIEIKDLKINDNETVEMIDLLHDRHRILEIKTDIKQNVSSIYLKNAEEKFNELHYVIDEVANFEKQQLSKDEIWNRSEVYDWDVTIPNNQAATSPVIQLFDLNFAAQLSVERRYNYFTIFLKLLNDDPKLPINQPDRTISKVTYVVPSSVGETNYTLYCKFNRTRFNEKLFLKSYYFYKTSQTRFSIKLFVEPPEVTDINTFSFNGTLIWRAKASRAVGGISATEFSPYFYTHPQGYRMRLQMSINFNKYTFELVVICGEYDAYLPTKFPYTTKLTVFNQNDPMRNLVVTKDFTQITGVTSVQLYSIEIQQLEILGYIKNKEVLVRLDIELL